LTWADDLRGSQAWSHGLVIRCPGRAGLHRARSKLRSGGVWGGAHNGELQSDLDAKAGRLADPGALLVGVLDTQGLDHYAVAMKDREVNEFNIN
jgi:hypothetical protein